MNKLWKSVTVVRVVGMGKGEYAPVIVFVAEFLTHSVVTNTRPHQTGHGVGKNKAVLGPSLFASPVSPLSGR